MVKYHFSFTLPFTFCSLLSRTDIFSDIESRRPQHIDRLLLCWVSPQRGGIALGVGIERDGERGFPPIRHLLHPADTAFVLMAGSPPPYEKYIRFVLGVIGVVLDIVLAFIVWFCHCSFLLQFF